MDGGLTPGLYPGRMARGELVPIERSILTLRGQRVILDRDLAHIYRVETRKLNQAVSRNPGRFPSDFCFRLTGPETANLKSQSVIPSGSWGGRRTLPVAFTEHGAVMAATVLNSSRAVQMSVYVVRASFTCGNGWRDSQSLLRGWMSWSAKLGRRIVSYRPSCRRFASWCSRRRDLARGLASPRGRHEGRAGDSWRGSELYQQRLKPRL